MKLRRVHAGRSGPPQCFNRRYGIAIPPPREQSLPQRRQRLPPPGVDRRRPLQRPHRLVHASTGEVRLPQVMLKRRVARNQGDRPLQQPDRLPRTTGLERQHPQPVQRPRVIRMMLGAARYPASACVNRPARWCSSAIWRGSWAMRKLKFGQRVGSDCSFRVATDNLNMPPLPGSFAGMVE